jgi:hypothetical protein
MKATVFEQKAPDIARKLMADVGLTVAQACGILGNLGHESAGFTAMQEMRPVAGMGGYGWAQWTGPRRRAFEQWCKTNRLNINSDEANYGFLKHELLTTEARSIVELKKTQTIEDATLTFERTFERAGVKAEASRIKYAKRAFVALQAAPPAAPVPPPPDVEPPAPKKKREPKPFTKKTLWTWLTTGGLAGIGGVFSDWKVALVIVGIGALVFLILYFTSRGK